ncbi:hypothetical protein [Planotetraspora kaengkrachanensis]|nr:hypothetical protein [Planotetraspora kaengkrachanensis]
MADEPATFQVGQPPEPTVPSRKRPPWSGIAVIVTVGLVVLVAASVFAAANREDMQSPCDRAMVLVGQVDDIVEHQGTTVGYVSPDETTPLWSTLTRMADGLAEGSYTDVDGAPSKELQAALFEFARTLPTSPGGLSDTGGDVQQSLRHIRAACA